MHPSSLGTALRPPPRSLPPPLTWAVRPRLHVTRIPDPTAAPPAVPGRFSPTPQARTAPEPGSAATLGIRGLRLAATPPPPRPGPPSGPAWTHAEAAPPTGPRRPHNRRRTHRNAGTLAPAASGPRRPGCAPEHPRPAPPPGNPGAAAAAALRGGDRPPPCPPLRRLLPAPAAATTAAPLPGAGTPASVERTARDALPRLALIAYAGRPPPIGPRAVARAGPGLSNSGRGGRRWGPGAEQGYYRSFVGAAADGTQPLPARGGGGVGGEG